MRNFPDSPVLLKMRSTIAGGPSVVEEISASSKSIMHKAMLSATSSTSAGLIGAETNLKNLAAKIVSRRFLNSSLASVMPICAFSSEMILLSDGSSLNLAIKVIGSSSKYHATAVSLSKTVCTKPISNPGVSRDKFNSGRRIPAAIPWLMECKKMVLVTQVEDALELN